MRAQKKYVFIYGRDGVELLYLKAHAEPTRLEPPVPLALRRRRKINQTFLLFYLTLTSQGNAGHLKYQDTSTSQLLCGRPTMLDACNAMARNAPGHQNGHVTF